MKIIKAIFVCCILNSYAAYAMNEKTKLITAHNHHHFQIKTIQDIPKFSFENIRHITNKPISLSTSSTFTIATILPPKITYKIITFMLDNDPLSAEAFYTQPLWYAFKRYDDARKMIQQSCNTIQKPINEFFRLSTKEQQLLLDHALISLELEKADTIITYDIGNVAQEMERLKKIAYYKLLAKASMIGFAIGGTFFLIPFLGAETYICFQKNTTSCFSDIDPITTSIFGICSTSVGAVYGTLYYACFKPD